VAWKANNWADYPWLKCRVEWRPGGTLPHDVFIATVDEKVWTIRLNNFPEEPMYTLRIDGTEIIHFDDWPFWPPYWSDPPELP
jgi:hypothetical protein